MLAFFLTLAHAGPVPMFEGPVPPPLVGTAPATTAPAGRAPRGVVVVAPIVIPRVSRPREPSLYAPTLPSRPEPTSPPALRRVPAEPHKVRVPRAGQLTPVSELPSAFQPIRPAPNRLPVTTIRRTEPRGE